MTREALKHALEALQSYNQYITPLTNAFGGPTVPTTDSTSYKVQVAIQMLERELAKTPAAWRADHNDGNGWTYYDDRWPSITIPDTAQPLYT